MHPLEHLFRPYEASLHEIISRYPSASSVACAGRAPGTVRQALSLALRVFVANEGITSIIPRDQAALVAREFVFSPNPDGSIYIGPKRKRISQAPITIASAESGASSPPSPRLPSIDCSDPVTLAAVLHLKNFDHIPVPLTLHNILAPIDTDSTYPNIELLRNTDGSFTIL